MHLRATGSILTRVGREKERLAEHERADFVKVTPKYTMGLNGLSFVSLLLLAQGFQLAQGKRVLLIFKIFTIMVHENRITLSNAALSNIQEEGCWDVEMYVAS